MDEIKFKKSTNLIIGAVLGLLVGVLSSLDLQAFLGMFSFACWIVLISGIPGNDSSKIRHILFYVIASGLPAAWFAFLVTK